MMLVDDILYIVVVDDELSPSAPSSFKYTRSALRSALQLMGCKARPAFKITRRVFEIMKIESSLVIASHLVTPLSNGCFGHQHQKDPLSFKTSSQNNSNSNSNWMDQYNQTSRVFTLRVNFLNVVCQTLAQYNYVGPKQREDVALACRIRERKESVTVLLCGTSGCGKSTLSSLLGSRLGVTTVVSTDSIRHMMRSFDGEKQNDLLWSSTYHAGEHLDPVAMANARTRRKARQLCKEPEYGVNLENKAPETGLDGDYSIGEKQMAIEGFKAQSEMVIENLDRLITAWEERKESVVVEGVHLSLNFVMGLMRKHPSIIPFMIYISNEEKHMERFAVRAKYMTLDPSKNKYVKYIRNIRAIQDYLCNRADKHLVPKVNNTNVDKSVAAIHATVFSCLRRRGSGECLYDPTTNTVPLIDEEYRNQRAANSLSSKGMFQLIQRKGSARRLMALVNTDGSVAKTWPVSPSANSNVGSLSYYGPLQIGKSEPVNLQFGSFGISAWPSDTCGTSYSGSFDDSVMGSRHYSSRCSSPLISDGPSKELKEESSVADSEEDTDVSMDTSDMDDNMEVTEEMMEGSVDDESSTQWSGEEEYGDLDMVDDLENGYCSDPIDFQVPAEVGHLANKQRATAPETWMFSRLKCQDPQGKDQMAIIW